MSSNIEHPSKFKLSEYKKIIEHTLNSIADNFDKTYNNSDVDYESGNLSCKIKGIGEYIFSKQPPTKQLWVSSPITGPKKFNYDLEKGWIESKINTSLDQYLSNEMAKIQKMLNTLKKT